MESKPDYYKILGVSRLANSQELRAAYHVLALRYHPDQNPDNVEAEEKFKQVSQAYAVLSDPQKRKQYDSFGLTHLVSGSIPFSFEQGVEGVKRFFETLFGELKTSRLQPKPGKDFRYELSISLSESVRKVTKTISFPVLEECPVCIGTGSDQGRVGWRICLHCEGEGQVKITPGIFAPKESCKSCAGTGRTIISSCPKCKGKGVVENQKTLQILLPAGLKEGEVRKISQRGEPGYHGGQNGDLWIVVHIKPHPLLHREGHHVTCDVPVTIAQAALGAKVSVPSLEGPSIELTIPAGTFSGTLLRVRGKGFPQEGLNDGARGDAFYRILIESPTSLSQEQLFFVQEFGRILKTENYPHQADFFKKMKEENQGVK